MKQEAVAVLTNPYATSQLAADGIATEFHKFYQSKYPDIEKNQQGDIQNAIAELQRIYRSTIFPEMKVDWKTHPNNIGHFYSPGCFRCHDGQHVSADGKVVTKQCDTCHSVLAQQEGAVSLNTAVGTEFKHPVDLGDLTGVSCTDCHTGGVGP
jgi:hypothetical protein